MHRCEWYKRHNNGLTGKGELMMSSPTMAAVDKPTRPGAGQKMPTTTTTTMTLIMA